MKSLTLGPGGPTLPAAPGKPVEPYQIEKESSKDKHTQTADPCDTSLHPSLYHKKSSRVKSNFI